jgi:hypothetical protein
MASGDHCVTLRVADGDAFWSKKYRAIFSYCDIPPVVGIFRGIFLSLLVLNFFLSPPLAPAATPVSHNTPNDTESLSKLLGSMFASKLEILSEKPLAESDTRVNSDHLGAVVVFLSAKCPCSDSHIEELVDLHKKFSRFRFLAVHSNTDEAKELTKNYFSRLKLPFTVVRDSDAKIADALKANKTPHAYLFNYKGDVVYQGGVSSSQHLASADHRFLREALDDLSHKRQVNTKWGRTLGCAISRDGTETW